MAAVAARVCMTIEDLNTVIVKAAYVSMNGTETLRVDTHSGEHRCMFPKQKVDPVSLLGKRVVDAVVELFGPCATLHPFWCSCPPCQEADRQERGTTDVQGWPLIAALFFMSVQGNTQPLDAKEHIMSLAELTALQAAARPLRTQIAALERQIADEEEMADPDGDKLTNWEWELEGLAPKLGRIEEDIFDLRTYMAEKCGCYCGSVSGFCDC